LFFFQGKDGSGKEGRNQGKGPRKERKREQNRGEGRMRYSKSQQEGKWGNDSKNERFQN
jgi:hypothetical protein